MLNQGLWWKILLGMVLGVTLGFLLSPSGFLSADERELSLMLGEWIALPGVVFLSLIQMVIIPLVVCSIILGIAESGNLGFLAKMGARLLPYFVLTTMISITIGLTLVEWIKPGLAIDQSLVRDILGDTQGTPNKTFDDLTIPQRIKNMLPSNPAAAGTQPRYVANRHCFDFGWGGVNHHPQKHGQNIQRFMCRRASSVDENHQLGHGHRPDRGVWLTL